MSDRINISFSYTDVNDTTTNFDKDIPSNESYSDISTAKLLLKEFKNFLYVSGFSDSIVKCISYKAPEKVEVPAKSELKRSERNNDARKKYIDDVKRKTLRESLKEREAIDME